MFYRMRLNRILSTFFFGDNHHQIWLLVACTIHTFHQITTAQMGWVEMDVKRTKERKKKQNRIKTKKICSSKSSCRNVSVSMDLLSYNKRTELQISLLFFFLVTVMVVVRQKTEAHFLFIHWHCYIVYNKRSRDGLTDGRRRNISSGCVGRKFSGLFSGNKQRTVGECQLHVHCMFIYYIYRYISFTICSRAMCCDARSSVSACNPKKLTSLT